jgi:hypothetical protein
MKPERRLCTHESEVDGKVLHKAFAKGGEVQQRTF